MALTGRQRAIVAFVLARADASRDWPLPWDNSRCNAMKDGGPPLKVTGEHWEEPGFLVFRREARSRNVQHPTWLTVAEITERGGTIAPGTTPAEVVVLGRPMSLYNVGQVEGLPEELSRRYWEIHPVNPGHRDPAFERFVSALDVAIRHSVDKPEQGERAAYLPGDRAIRIPPFEMFFTAPDYYLTLTHELIHWAEDSTSVVGPSATRDDAIRGWRELVAEFGAVFACEELDLQGVPVASPIDYIDYWRNEGRLNDAEVLDAAEAAATLASWLCQIAPGWRTTTTEPRWPAPQGDQRTRITSHTQHFLAEPRTATLEAAAHARTLVVSATALGKMDPGKDPDAGERQATRLIERARQIDLTIPAVVAAIEAAVALTTPLDASPVTAATWLKAFRERTMRIRTMRELTRSASKRAETTSPTRSITP